jgi:polysaccharide export outer membrane protein
VQSVPTTSEGDGRIQPRDTIVVIVQGQKEMSGEFVIREDGGYIQPPLGNVMVQGKTAEEVGADIQLRLKDMVTNPRVTVSLARVAPIRVSVVGEVKTPGTYELTRDRGVSGALAAAGWLTDFASRDKIFVVRAGNATTRIRFRLQDLTSAEPISARFRLHDGDVVVAE